MPEARVLQFFKREICFKAKTRKTKVREPDWDTKCTGRLVAHIPCLSRKDGNKQTITFHEAPLDDSLFLPIAIPAGQKKKGTSRACSRCQKSGAKAACRSDEFIAEPELEARAVPPFAKQPKMYSGELLNALNISGQLSVEVRGKELVLLIGGSYAIRVNFCMEGHCFWMPTKMYEAIVEGGVHSRGEKSKSFHVPHHLTEAPPIVDMDGDDSESEDDTQSTTEDDSDEESEMNSTPPTPTEPKEPKPKKYKGITLSIQLAFVCPDWTLIFTDHNTCFNVHVMPLRYHFQPEDISFGGQLYPYVWSSNHGPDFLQEPEAARNNILRWRESNRTIPTKSRTIFETMSRERQDIFNGFGAQETTDALAAYCLIHPVMPVHLICSSDTLFQRLIDGIFSYTRETSRLLFKNKLPLISGPRPFKFNANGHNNYLTSILCCRREKFSASQQYLDSCSTIGYLSPSRVILDSGETKQTDQMLYKPQYRPKEDYVIRAGASIVYLDVYQVTWHKSAEKTVSSYTPFTAQPARDRCDWPDFTFRRVESDVKADQNTSTLGLYSFNVLVQCTWSKEKVDLSDKPKGRRSSTVAGNAILMRPILSNVKASTMLAKRPRSEDILYRGEPEIEEKENIDPDTVLADEGKRRLRRRLN